MKAHHESTSTKATCTAHTGEHSKGAGRRPRQDDKHFGGGHGRSSTPVFSLSLGFDLKMRRTGLNQVERERIVIRCVNKFVYLPAGCLNRATHERPVYLSPRFEEAARWCGGGWRRI